MANSYKTLASSATKDPAKIRELANQYLASGDKTLQGWANTALRDLKNYEGILASGSRGGLSKGKYKYADSAAFAQSKLDSAYKWISGGAQPYKGAVAFGETPTPAAGSFAATHTPAEVAAVNTKPGATVQSAGNPIEMALASGPSAQTSGTGSGVMLGKDQPPTPASYNTDLAGQVQAAISSVGDKLANKDFINATFKAYHNRDANAQELAKFGSMSVSAAGQAIIGGSPLNRTTTPDFSAAVSEGPSASGFRPDEADFSALSPSENMSDAFVQSLTALDSLFEAAKSPDQLALEAERAGLEKGLTADMKALEGKGAAQLALEKAAGVPEKVKQLEQLNLLIAQRMSAYQAGQVKIENQAIPQGLIIGQGAALQKQQAVELGMLYMQAAALTDNITLAQDLAQRTVDLEFSDEEQRIANTMTFLELNKDKLTAEESKQASKVQMILDERSRALEEQKAEKQANLDLLMQAASQGLDTTVIDVNAPYARNVERMAPRLALSAQAQSRDLAEADEFERATKLIGLLEKLPVGQTIELGGSVYSSLNTGEVMTGTETSGGKTYLWSFNKDTGEKRVSLLGSFGDQKYTDVKSNEGAIVRVFEDGTKRMMFDPRQPNGGIAQGGLVELFPQGSVTPFTRPNDSNKDLASECGAWVNDCTGLGVGDTFASKKAKMDPGITAASAEIGDVFLQPFGTTGHIGIINGISEIDGERIFTVSESNWSKVPGSGGSVGAITHTRQIKESEIAGFSRPGFAQSFYNFGTGAPSTDTSFDLQGLTFGDQATIADTGEKESILSDKIGLIDSLLTSKGLRGSVGTYGIGRWTPFTADLADRQEFAAGVNQLIGKETIDTLINLKAQGGTLGALSDQERVLLQTAASKIGSWMQRDKNGNPTGKFEISEDAFKRELLTMRTLAERALSKARGTSSSGGSIRVRLKSSGQTGTLPASEFDPNLYERVE